MRLAAFLLVAALLAGCSEPSGPSADPRGTTTSTAPPSASSSSSTAAPPPPAPREVPYSFAGRTWTTVCVVAQPAVGQCQHVAEGSAITESLPEESVVRFQGTLTWTEGNEEVGIGLVWEEPDGSIGHDPAFYVAGPSPLSFDWSFPHLAEKDLAYHVASYVNAGPPEAHASASPGQEWSLEAVLTVLPPGNASASAGSGSSSPAGNGTVEQPVHVRGNTAAGACLAAGGQEVLCHHALTEEAFGSLPSGRVPLRLTGTLTWTAASPASETLTLYVPTHDGGQYHWEPGYPSAAGTSPLSFDLDLVPLQGHALGLVVGNGFGAGVPTGYAMLQAPQEFVLDAVLVAAA